MLTRASAVARRMRGAVLAAVTVVAWGVVAPVAVADSPVGDAPVVCPPDQTICIVQVAKPAQPAGQQSTGRPVVRTRPTCRVPEGRANAGEAVPCTATGFGTWNNADGCYHRLLQPQPARSDPVWEGHTDGAIYESYCPGIPGTGGGWAWSATPPEATALGTVDPAVLAQRAVRQLALRGPAIGMAPPVGALGLVHVPVWVWTAVTPTTWGPASATVSVPGVSVTAVARAVQVTWDMGDGHVVRCSGPGTVYSPDLATTTSPTCGHVYERSSAGQPGDTYPVTAVTTWQVTWSGGGQAGALTVTRTSRTRVRIGEMQALT